MGRKKQSVTFVFGIKYKFVFIYFHCNVENIKRDDNNSYTHIVFGKNRRYSYKGNTQVKIVRYWKYQRKKNRRKKRTKFNLNQKVRTRIFLLYLFDYNITYLRHN